LQLTASTEEQGHGRIRSTLFKTLLQLGKLYLAFAEDLPAAEVSQLRGVRPFPGVRTFEQAFGGMASGINQGSILVLACGRQTSDANISSRWGGVQNVRKIRVSQATG
jgi:hypothetical protein